MPSPFQDQFIHVMSTLFIFVLVILALAFFYKKFGQSFSGMRKELSVLATLSLGTREKLMVVQVGNEQILLGVTHQHITKLHDLKDPLVIPEKSEAAGKHFKKILDGLKK